jgi:predicted protein tyrosine phosphatase
VILDVAGSNPVTRPNFLNLERPDAAGDAGARRALGLPPLRCIERVCVAVPGFVPFHLTVCGIEELGEHCAVGVSHVLSILDPAWPEPEAFGAYGEHERLELRFHDIIDEATGMQAPQPEDVERVLAFGRDLMREPGDAGHLLVHCHMGISRSTAAMTLILAQARPDRPAAEALAEVTRIRPRAWPNLRMIEFGDAMLGRGGDLVAAAHAQYGARAATDPDFARAIARYGRLREVPDLPGLL